MREQARVRAGGCSRAAPCMWWWVDITNRKEAALNSFGVVPVIVQLFRLILPTD